MQDALAERKNTQTTDIAPAARYPNTPESLALANDEPWDDDMYDRAQARSEAGYEKMWDRWKIHLLGRDNDIQNDLALCGFFFYKLSPMCSLLGRIINDVCIYIYNESLAWALFFWTLQPLPTSFSNGCSCSGGQAHLEAFYVEVFLELANYGEIEDR